MEHHRPIAGLDELLGRRPEDEDLAVRRVEGGGVQRAERERADDSGEREPAPALAPGRLAAGSGDEMVAEAVEVGREHDLRFALLPRELGTAGDVTYMDLGGAVCQPAPPQAAGTAIGCAPVIEPSPGRPVIMQ
jgi:hypothetical protein